MGKALALEFMADEQEQFRILRNTELAPDRASARDAAAEAGKVNAVGDLTDARGRHGIDLLQFCRHPRGDGDEHAVAQAADHEAIAQAHPQMYGIEEPAPVSGIALLRKALRVHCMHHQHIARERVAMTDHDGVPVTPLDRPGRGQREDRDDDGAPEMPEWAAGRDQRQPWCDSLDLCRAYKGRALEGGASETFADRTRQHYIR
jgi:hypothetical protein